VPVVVTVAVTEVLVVEVALVVGVVYVWQQRD
jgi:hypothetical protein